MDGAAATAVVRQERSGGVLVLIMAERPVNALTPALRAGLAAGLQAAADDPDVRAVVICSALAAFSAGLTAPDETGKCGAPALAELCTQIENSGVPVVVALNGMALAGGVELALAAHGRVAAHTARLGCPEVSLGLVPKAGATQRLPRLIGAEAALRLMLEPGPVSAAQALALGLVDEVAETALIERALVLAEALAGRPPRKTSDRREGFRDPKAYQKAIAAARQKFDLAHLPAAGRLIDCVEAAQLLPLEQGLAFEGLACADLARTAQARGLQHIMAAEQRAGLAPAALNGVAVPAVSAIALWGGGEAAADIAMQALQRGMGVTVVEPDRGLLVKTVERVAARQAAAVAEGRLTEQARDADWARLLPASTGEGLAATDLVLVSGDADDVPETFKARMLSLGALPLRAGPGRLGLHAAVAAGLPAELCFTQGADVQVMARALALARRLGWRLYFTGPGGPLDRRLRAALSAAIAHLESLGHDRAEITAALASFGVGVGARADLPKAAASAKPIVDACLAALAAEGARLLGEGCARRASDVDAVAVAAGLFPRWQGGPMFWADQRGLLVLRSDLRHRAEAVPELYQPHGLFDHLIGAGLNFASIDPDRV